MTFLPIVDRELRVRARRKSTHWLRLGAAVVAILIAGFLLLVIEGVSSPGSFGGGVFETLAWLTFGFCLLEGARNTADCLSEEKRDGTLGLLFLTDLKGYDVVLGKLIATSLNSFYGLLAVFPPLAIPLVLGGVTGGEFWRVVLALLNALFFSLATGLFISAVSRHERRAWGLTLLVVLIFAVVPPLLPLLVSFKTPLLALFYPRVLSDWLGGTRGSLLSPTSTLLAGFDAQFSAAVEPYWLSLLFIHLQCWGFLLGASFLLPRCWQETPVRQPSARSKRLLARLWPGNSARYQRERRRLLCLNPLAWLATRWGERKSFPWFIVAVFCGTGITVMRSDFSAGQQSAILFLIVLGLHFSLAIYSASQACYLFADARDSGVLELLLSTPLTIQEIIEGHFQALKRLLYSPIVTLLLAEMLVMATCLASSAMATDNLPEPLLASVGVALCLVSSVMDLYATAVFGLWMGLTSRRPSQALTKTVLFVLVLPLVSGCCCVALWPIVGIAKNLIFIYYGRDQLRRHFRTAVTERYSAGSEIQHPSVKPPKPDPSELPPVLSP